MLPALRARLTIPLLLVALCGCALSGCAAVGASPQEPANAAADSPDRLPSALERLDPTPKQRKQLLALADELERDLEPLIDAGRHFGRAVAVASRQCKGDSTVLDMEAEFMVRVGEEARPKVLDAIQKLHGILTPKQRRALVDRLLDINDDRDGREERDESAARSIGGDLDLSVGQMLSLLMRVQLLRSSFEDQMKPWRTRYKKALKAFAKDDFDIRKHDVAEFPLVEIGTELLRDAMRLLVPVLDPPQCKVLGDMIDKALEKSEDKKKASKDKP